MKASFITDNVLDAVEEACGMGADAWDCIDPKEIIAASINAMGMEIKCPECGLYISVIGNQVSRS
jgi:hypothetical protein